MDKQLLQALDNLSYGLEVLVEALKQKGAKSDTGNALQSGNFDKSLESITVELKSIKKDTQEILKNQQTIISLQKQKNSDKKTEAIEDASGPKKESKIKKGVSTILLIAVAVLAIGLAFKLVGKIDFLSVIALGAAIYLMSMAFEKVAKLDLSIKEAFNVSVVLVLIAVAITASSWILKLIAPIGISQLITGILISTMFVVMSKNLENIFIATAVFSKLKVKKRDLTLTLVAISAAITASSWILKLIVPISFAQAMTGIMISLMFMMISYNLHKIGLAVAMFKKIPGLKPKDLVMVLLGVATAITVSSWILNFIAPLSFPQALTGILISAMFFIITFNLEKIAMGVVAFKKTKVKATDLLLVLVGIAAAITASSWVLSLILPLTFDKFLTALGIAILFAMMSYIMPELAAGVYILEKSLGKKGLFFMPLLFVAISLAIMLSSHILAETADIEWMMLLKILAFSIVMTISVVVVGIGSLILSKIGLTNIAKGAVSIVILATAIFLSSKILSKGTYKKYPDWKWTIEVLIVILLFGVSAWFLNKLGLTNIAKGAVSIVILATAIFLSSKILSKGTYKKYPDWKWSLSTTLSLVLFGGAAWLLNKLGLTNIVKGSLVIVVLAGIIMLSSLILNLGSYKNYPSLKWSIGVGLALAAFGVGAFALGVMVFGPQALIFAAGLGAILVVAGTILATSKILSKGKYDNPGILSWAMSTALLYTTFAPIILILGSVGVAANAMGAIFGKGANPFEVGRKMITSIAKTIVQVSYILSKGSYKGGPTKKWAEGIAIALGAFAPVYRMLVASSIMKIFGGGGVGPKEFSTAIKTVSRGIVDAAGFFAKNKAAFINGPSKEWSEGVGMAIGAFAPVYKILLLSKLLGTSVSVEKFSNAIRVITKGIISSAYIFSKNKSPFKEGNYPSVKWGKGVGAALGAFAPVFKSLSEDTGWFTSGDDVINNMVNGVVKISKAIVRVANIFSYSKADWGSYPTKKWSFNVKNSVGSFIRLVKSLGNDEIQYGVIVGAVLRMKKVSRILSDGKFSLKIDPNYFKTVGKNILDFNNVVKKIAQSETLGSKISSFISGNDPIIQVAKRMVILSKGYDALAKSLIRLGSAMKTLNIKNLQQLGSIRGLSSESVKSSEVRTPSFVSSVTSRLFGKDEQGSSIKSKRSSGAEDKKNQISYVSNQLEKVVKILTNIDKTASTIDEYIAEYIAEQGGIKAPEIET